MTRYILDTQAVVWFLENNPKLPHNIREDIEYLQYEYYVSFLSLMEIDNLQKLDKIKLKHGLKDVIKQLNEAHIGIYLGSLKELDILDGLDMKTINNKTHGDYIDRMIIATCIARRHTCISSDKLFLPYRKNGLSLLEI